MSRPFLTAEWRNLGLLSWEVEPARLDRRVPAGTEIDSWRGRTYVSLLAFRFLNTKVLGFGIPGNRNFEEVNLRFYVRRGDRRGVVFIKEVVPKRAVAWTARALFGENYVARPTSSQIGPGAIAYSWAGNRMTLVHGPMRALESGSQEEFIVENYWGYTRRGQSTFEYQVEHPKWPVSAARLADFRCDFGASYGREFIDLSKRSPDSILVAEGSPVKVFWRARVY